MKKWLTIGLLGVVVVWGPFVYSELVRSPVRSSGKGRHTLSFFSNEDDDTAEKEPEPAAEDPAQPSTDKAASTDKPEDKAEEPEDKAAAKVAEKPAPKPSDNTDEAAKEEAEDPEEPRPVLPSSLSATFRKVLDTEPRDAFWANDEEPKLRGLFKEAGATPDMLSEVACRTTVCRVVFTPDDIETEPLTKLYVNVRARYGEALALDAKPGAVGERATLYVLRPGYKLDH